jgi:transcriptional regulator with XRE-family HTH domain
MSNQHDDDPANAMASTAIDAVVGSRIRQRRQILEMTATHLASQVGCQPEDVLKFESGAVRIGAAQLHKIAQALNVYLDWFFTSGDPADTGSALDLLALAEQFAKVSDPTAREQVISFTRQIAVSQSIIARRSPNKALN